MILFDALSFQKNRLRKIDEILEKSFMKSDDPLRSNHRIKSISVPYITHRYQELFGGNWVSESDGFVQITFAARTKREGISRTDYGSTWTLEAMRSKKCLLCFSRGFTLNTAFFSPSTISHFSADSDIRKIYLASLRFIGAKCKAEKSSIEVYVSKIFLSFLSCVFKKNWWYF